MQSELAENAAKVAEIQSGLALLVMVGTMGKTSSKKLATQERYLKDEAPRTATKMNALSALVLFMICMSSCWVRDFKCRGGQTTPQYQTCAVQWRMSN